MPPLSKILRARRSVLTNGGRLFTDQRGATLVIIALAAVAILGFAGIGAETGVWYVKKRDMQAAADAAAFSAALANAGGSGVYTTEAKATTATYGFVDQNDGVTVAVNKPPTSGNYTASPTAIEVIVQQPQQRLFSALFLPSPWTLSARAVALPGLGPDCVLSLDSGVSADVFANGTTTVNLIKCGIAVDSSSSSALDIVGGAEINADTASIVGGVSGNGTLNTVNGTVTGATPTLDPYQDVQMPSYTGCNQSDYSLNTGSASFSASGGTPYVFCSGISLNAGATLNLSNGIFVIDTGTLSIKSGATLNVTNATIVLTSSTGDNYATVAVNGGAVVNATAPTSGPTAGLAFFQDRAAPTGVTDTFAGGTTQNITGAIYLPRQVVSFAGGTQTGSGCTQIVADEVDFKGDANLNIDCTGTGVRTISSSPRLVE